MLASFKRDLVQSLWRHRIHQSIMSNLQKRSLGFLGDIVLCRWLYYPLPIYIAFANVYKKPWSGSLIKQTSNHKECNNNGELLVQVRVVYYFSRVLKCPWWHLCEMVVGSPQKIIPTMEWYPRLVSVNFLQFCAWKNSMGPQKSTFRRISPNFDGKICHVRQASFRRFGTKWHEWVWSRSTGGVW